MSYSMLQDLFFKNCDVIASPYRWHKWQKKENSFQSDFSLKLRQESCKVRGDDRIKLLDYENINIVT